MSKQIPSKFETFEFDNPQEEIVSKTFHPLNVMYFKNLRTELMHLRLGQKFDPKNPETFLQDNAFVDGKLAVLNELIGD